MKAGRAQVARAWLDMQQSVQRAFDRFMLKVLRPVRVKKRGKRR